MIPSQSWLPKIDETYIQIKVILQLSPLPLIHNSHCLKDHNPFVSKTAMSRTLVACIVTLFLCTVFIVATNEHQVRYQILTTSADALTWYWYGGICSCSHMILVRRRMLLLSHDVQIKMYPSTNNIRPKFR